MDLIYLNNHNMKLISFLPLSFYFERFLIIEILHLKDKNKKILVNYLFKLEINKLIPALNHQHLYQ